MKQELCSNPKFASCHKTKVAVFLGGSSPERKISLKSGRSVAQALKNRGYQVQKINPRYIPQSQIKKKNFDVAFIALHGKGGEDGTLQKFFEKNDIPYIGSDVKGCQISFDKLKTKIRLIQKSLPTPPYLTLSLANFSKQYPKIKGPFFAKPLQDGSSLGIFSVDDPGKARALTLRSLKKHSRLLVEEKIVGREFTVGVLKGKALPVIELKPKGDFYDYKSKYTKGMCQYLVPAPIDKALESKLKKLAKKTHDVLGLRDLSRIDFMVDMQNRPYILEANAIPGFTEFSLLPKAAREIGVNFEELCHQLVQSALKRSSSPKKR